MKKLPVKDSLGALPGQVARLMGNQLTANFHQAGYDLTVEQWVVLVNLWESDGVTQQNLADRGYKHKATVTSLINYLEKNGFVERMNNLADGRANLIQLTEQGHALKEPLMKIAYLTIQETVAGIDPVALETCRRVLMQLRSNLLKPS